MKNDHRIIPFEKSQFETVNEALALAMVDDPFMKYFTPNDSKRKSVSKWFWRSTLILGMRWGLVETDESGRSAAIWMPPGGTDVPMHRIMRTPFIQLPFRLGLGGMSRFIRANGPIEKAHKEQMLEPHWYLMVLGVHPDLQGTGIGSALLSKGHDRASDGNHPCYLETTTEYDVQFYSKRGYREGEKFDLSEMNVVTMVRDSSR